MRSIFGEGVGLDGETVPLPEIRFAPLANFDPPSRRGWIFCYAAAYAASDLAIVPPPSTREPS
jgi:hypothetical protein